MDEGTATVIASVIAASGSIAVAWITTRPHQSPPPPPASPPPDWATQSLRPAFQPTPAPNHKLAKALLYFLYFLTAVLLIICGTENDINQQEANAAAGFAILFGVAAWFIRKRIKAMPPKT